MLETESDDLTNGPVQFGGKLHTRRARANDGHVQFVLTQQLRLRVGPKTGIDQALVEALRIRGAFELQGMARDAWSAEVVALATDRDDQGVIADDAARGDLSAF